MISLNNNNKNNNEKSEKHQELTEKYPNRNKLLAGKLNEVKPKKKKQKLN